MRSAVNTSRNSWLAQVMQNRFVALVLAMIVAVPFIAMPADFHLGGVGAVVLQGFALMLGVALLWRSQWKVSGEQVKTFLKTGPNTPVLLLAGLLVVSCVFAQNTTYGVHEMLRWGAGIMLFFVVAYQFRQSKHLFLLVDAILFLGIAASIFALGQYAVDPASRGTMLFGNQQLLGSFLMILLPVAAVIALAKADSEKTSVRQLVAQFATVLMAGCLLLAQTRSAWMGALTGSAVLGVLMVLASAKTGSLRSQKHKLVLPGVLATVAVAFFLMIGFGNGSIVDRAGTLSNVSGVTSWQARLQQWQGTVAMIAERPLSGVGVGQYPVLQHNYTAIGSEITANGLAGVRNSLTAQAHNFYLQTAAELGLPGLVLMVAVLGMFFVAGARRVTSMDAGIRRNLLMASMASVSGFAVDAISSPSWQVGQVSIFFWLMLGVGVACMRPRSQQSEEVATLSAAPALVRPLAVAAALLAMVMVVLPTSGVAVAADYRDNDDSSEVKTIAVVGALAIGLAYLTGNLGAGAGAGAGAEGGAEGGGE